MYEYYATVVKIVDADTIDVDIDLGLHVWKRKERLRLAGLNAPEMSTPEGVAATAYLVTVLPVGTQVTVRTTVDRTEKYGRYLATVMLGAVNVNELLISTGHAVPWNGVGARP